MPVGTDTQYHQAYQARQMNYIFTTDRKRCASICIIDGINNNGICIRFIHAKQVTRVILFHDVLLPTDT